VKIRALGIRCGGWVGGWVQAQRVVLLLFLGGVLAERRERGRMKHFPFPKLYQEFRVSLEDTNLPLVQGSFLLQPTTRAHTWPVVVGRTLVSPTRFTGEVDRGQINVEARAPAIGLRWVP